MWLPDACLSTNRDLRALCDSGWRIQQTSIASCQCFSQVSLHTAQAHGATIFASVAFADRFCSSMKTAKAASKLVRQSFCVPSFALRWHRRRHTSRACLRLLPLQEWWLPQFLVVWTGHRLRLSPQRKPRIQLRQAQGLAYTILIESF